MQFLQHTRAAQGEKKSSLFRDTPSKLIFTVCCGTRVHPNLLYLTRDTGTRVHPNLYLNIYT